MPAFVPTSKESFFQLWSTNIKTTMLPLQSCSQQRKESKLLPPSENSPHNSTSQLLHQDEEGHLELPHLPLICQRGVERKGLFLWKEVCEDPPALLFESPFFYSPLGKSHVSSLYLSFLIHQFPVNHPVPDHSSTQLWQDRTCYFHF